MGTFLGGSAKGQTLKGTLFFRIKPWVSHRPGSTAFGMEGRAQLMERDLGRRWGDILHGGSSVPRAQVSSAVIWEGALCKPWLWRLQLDNSV